jgi:ATP-dependent DNA ligase
MAGSFARRVVQHKLGGKLVLLAPNEQLPIEELPLPLYSSTKFDGWRILVTPDGCFTRSGETIPNPLFSQLPHIKAAVRYCAVNEVLLDGEIIGLPFNELSGLLRRTKNTPEDAEKIDLLTIGLFDLIDIEEYFAAVKTVPFKDRMEALKTAWFESAFPHEGFFLIEQKLLSYPSHVADAFDVALEFGFEGLILRSENGLYKNGRATHNEGIIFKMKPSATIDCKIVEVVPRTERAPQGTDKDRFTLFHRKKRSYASSNYEAVNAVGSFKVTHEGKTFHASPGKGMTMRDRARMWDEKESLIGKIVEIEYMDYGGGDAPRHPRVVRFRPDKDRPDGGKA